MIVNFSIQNFGSIRDLQTLSFEASKDDHLEDQYIIHAGGLRLLKLILIYGANASGKTTVLKALDFLRDLVVKPKRLKSDTLDFQPFLLDPDTPNQTSLLGIEFVKNDVRYAYEVEFTKHAVVREELIFYKPNKASLFKRITDLEKQYASVVFGNKIKKAKELERAIEPNTLWNNTVLGGFLKTNLESGELKEVLSWFQYNLKRLVSKETNIEQQITSCISRGEIQKKDILAILKKADLNISDILINKSEQQYKLKAGISIFSVNSLKSIFDTIGEEYMPLKLEFVYNFEDQAYVLPFGLESLGTQRYYQFSGLLAQLIRNSNVASIDELEDSLHPDLYIHFLLSFLVNATSSQIVATTHNREVLNDKDIFRNDAIWFTDRSETGATELYSLTDFDSSVIRDTTNVLNAYKSGKLRGAPNLGDYYIDLSNEKEG